MAESKVKSASDKDRSAASLPAMLVRFQAPGSVDDGDTGDFELDDILRGLTLERWFATAQEDVPIWAF